MKLREQPISGTKFKLKDWLLKALEKKLPNYTVESLAKKKYSAAEARKNNPVDGLSSFSKTALWKELKPNEAAVEEPANPSISKEEATVLITMSVIESGGGPLCSGPLVHCLH